MSLFRDNELVGPADKKRKRNPAEALLQAANDGAMECLEALLQQEGIQVNLQNKHGWTAVMKAALHGHTKCLNLLLLHKANPDLQNNLGWSALMIAAKEGRINCLERLLSQGADVDHHGNKSETALVLASYKGHTDCVRALVNCGANVNFASGGGETPLIVAAKYGNLKCLKLLLNSADVDINVQNPVGITALMFAARNGTHACLKKLLEKDADPNARTNDGDTALMIAALKGHTESLKDLLQHKAVPNLQNKYGWTALMLAAANGHTECLKALLEHGADMTAKNNRGKTALMLPRQQACVTILEAAAAAAAAKENQVEPSELDDASNEAIDQMKKIYADRRLRLKQDYELKESEMRDRWKTKPPPNLLRDAHDDRVRHRVGHDPVLQRLLADRDALAKQQLESERTAALNAVRGEYQAKLASLNEAEQTKLRKIEAKPQELHQKYSEAYVADHRCAVCYEIKESLGVALACGHRLCKGCVGRVKNKCPHCRQKSRASDQRPIHASVRSRGHDRIVWKTEMTHIDSQPSMSNIEEDSQPSMSTDSMSPMDHTTPIHTKEGRDDSL